jgi:hypothetical protein
MLRSLQEIQPFLMEEDSGGGQGLSWAVEPRRRGVEPMYTKNPPLDPILSQLNPVHPLKLSLLGDSVETLETHILRAVT